MRKIKVKHRHNKKIKKRVKDKQRDRILTKIQKNGFVVHKRAKSYISGIFWSVKNNKEHVFRSTYEFGYFLMLENDDTVVSYVVEPFGIPYKHPFDNKIHKYWPDILILYKSGALNMVEIKPKCKVDDAVVQRKAVAARAHIRRNNMDAEYLFITEEDIFDTSKDYLNLKKLLLQKKYVL